MGWGSESQFGLKFKLLERIILELENAVHALHPSPVGGGGSEKLTEGFKEAEVRRPADGVTW